MEKGIIALGSGITMADKEDKLGPMSAFVLVALLCGGASFGIVAMALMILHTISDIGMCAIAVMTFAPALMGIGIAFFISRSLPKG